MRKRKIISEINVTPFVDVMLVLLIIFMVTTPIILSEIPLSLPKTNNVKNLEKKDPNIISLSADGRMYFNSQIVNGYSELVQSLKSKNIQDLIYIKADKNINYGIVVSLMNQLQQNNYGISLITEDE